MILLIECLVSVLIFTLLIVPSVKKNPLKHIGDYPDPIIKKCEELGLIEKRNNKFSKMEVIKKIIVSIVFAILFALILFFINGAKTFLDGFIYSLIIWLAVTWYDALILDCAWFCHDKSIVIPGTEGMKEYKDYLYHIKQSLIGTGLGIIVSLVVGFLVWIMTLI